MANILTALDRIINGPPKETTTYEIAMVCFAQALGVVFHGSSDKGLFGIYKMSMVGFVRYHINKNGYSENSDEARQVEGICEMHAQLLLNAMEKLDELEEAGRSADEDRT